MSVTTKGMATPDDTMSFDRGSIRVLRVGTSVLRLNTFEPGWRWSQSVGPTAGTATCHVHHIGYLLSGTLRIAGHDGEREIHSGDAYEILPDHDGWVVGDETVRAIEFTPREP